MTFPPIPAPTLSVIVMAFNEANSIEIVVREIDSVSNTLRCPYEIIIVDDGSSDGTGMIADRLAEQIISVRAVHHETNQGLGAVYQTGFHQAQGDFVTFLPADGQFPATIIKQFVPLMRDADMILSYVPNRPCSLFAKSLSKIERMLYRLFFGPLPKIQGTLMFKRRLLDTIALSSEGQRGWAIVLELIIRASRGGYKIISVPIELRPRMCGTSKVRNLSTIWANLKQMILLTRKL